MRWSGASALLPGASVMLLAVSTGCSSVTKAAHETSQAVSGGYAAAVEAGRSLARLFPGRDGPRDPAEARELMLTRAGTSHFQNPGFIEARDGLHPQETPFTEARDNLRSERFKENKEKFRSVESPTFQGSLGKALGVGVESGLRITDAAVHPVLGILLPGFVERTDSVERD